MNTLLSSL